MAYIAPSNVNTEHLRQTPHGCIAKRKPEKGVLDWSSIDTPLY